MNADLEEIPPAEADLKQQVEDLHVHIRQQLEWNNGFLCGSCSQHSQPLHYPATLNDKQKDAGVPLTSHLNESSMRSKDINTSSTNIETVKKQAIQHLPTKQLLHKQQLSLPDHDKIISSWLPATSPVEALIEPAASFTSRKFALRSEVNPQQETISTSFALTKLTSRLNFLKEKRTQITKDIQNFDKGLGSDSQSHQNQENV
uniref:Uncharacterized protein n=1 Tax=Vitis vinifera TaxID=29760 RepID=F6HWB5_VITVI